MKFEASLLKLPISIFLLIFIQFYYQARLYYVDVKDLQVALELVNHWQSLNLGFNVNAKDISKSRQNGIWRDIRKFYHPDTVLEDNYIWRQQSYGDTIRKHIQVNYFDSQPLHQQYQTQTVLLHKDKPQSDFTSNMIHQKMFTRDKICEAFGLFERIYHLPFPADLSNKITLAKNMKKAFQNFTQQQKSNQCLKDAQFQKRTYILDDPNDCQEFFSKAIGEYENNSTQEVFNYIKKTFEHEQRGTEMAYKAVFHQTAEKYEYGAACLKLNNSHQIIMQEYILNPLILDGRKFDIRLMMLLTSTNPPILYLYKKLYLMQCSYMFNHSEFKNQSHICSAGYQRKLNDLLDSQNDMEGTRSVLIQEKEKLLPFNQVMEDVTYEEFARRLIAEGKIKDSSWIEQHFIPEMEKKFYHLLHSYFEGAGYWPDPRIGEYQACEIALDDDLNVWILECTANPTWIPKPDAIVLKKYLHQLHKDSIPIMVEYARAKYQRIKRMIKEFLVPEVKKCGGSLPQLKLRYKELWPRIQDSLKDEVIEKKEFDEAYHRVNLEQAAQSCV